MMLSVRYPSSGLRVVVVAALLSRLLCCCVMLAADWALDDYDTSAALSPSQSTLSRVLTAFHRWDGVYFVHLAHSGEYAYDKLYAFLPGYPSLVRGVRGGLAAAGMLPPSPPDDVSATLLSAVLLSNTAFVMAAACLFLLTRHVFSRPRGEDQRGEDQRGEDQQGEDQVTRFSLLCSLCFCFTPASVFCSAAYSESVFAALSLAGLLAWVHAQCRCWRLPVWTARLHPRSPRVTMWLLLSTVLFSLASWVRSNGVTLCGFPAFACLHEVRTTVQEVRTKLHCRGVLSSTPRPRRVVLSAVTTIIHSVLSCLLQCCVIVLPLVLHLADGYHVFCGDGPSEAPAWCRAWPPSIYTYVQARFWGVGFLRYMTLKQLPNFILAVPAVLSTMLFVGAMAREDVMGFLSGGLMGRRDDAGSAVPPLLLPFLWHWVALMVLSLPFINVQVVTRLVLACPAVFWGAGMAVSGIADEDQVLSVVTPRLPWGPKLGRALGYTWVTYATVYIVVGSVLFSNFYPWT